MDQAESATVLEQKYSRRTFIKGVIATGATASSTPRTRACGIGERRSFANTIPGARKSSAYFARPVIFAWRSGGAVSVPTSRSAMIPPYTLRASSAARIAQVRILS